MRLSLIIPTRNEVPERLARTVASLGPYVDEVIVVDDGGDQRVDRAGLPAGTLVHRNIESMGCSSARNVGAALATGDVLLTADSHVTVATGDMRALCLVAHDRQAIIQPATVSDDWPKNPWCTYGDTLCPYPAGKITGRFGAPTTHYEPSTGLYGSVYAFPRQVWDRIGHGVYSLAWGGAEEGLALAAGLCTVPIFVARDVRCTHTFNNSGKFAYSVPADWWKLNWWLIHHRWAEPAYWRYYWRPLLEAMYPDLEARGRALTDDCRQALLRRTIAAALRRVSDDTFWDSGRRLQPLSPAAIARLPSDAGAATFHAARPWLTGRPAAQAAIAVPFPSTPSMVWL